jgi:prolyl-tRNA synthetase
MKDSYSLDIDAAGLDVQFDNHFAAYGRIFDRIGLRAIPVEASSGVMGGTESVEFMVESPAGEDDIAVCGACSYAANLEKATSTLPAEEDEPWQGSPERFATPGIRTIAELADAFDFAAADRQVKTLVYVADGDPVLVLLRGDHQLQEQKLIDGLGTAAVRPAHSEEIVGLMGASAGSLGAVGVSGIPIVADPALAGRANMTTGANEDDWHLRGVDVERDIAVDRWIDLRTVTAGEACPSCGQVLDVKRVIEVGHIFKLGTKYTEALGVTVLDERGDERTVVMGSYGIGVGRAVASVVEANHDERGIVWPVTVAPFEVVVTVLKTDDPETLATGERLYAGLRGAGIDVLLDDRPERPGVKFADAELVGIPYRVTVGPRGLAEGVVEVQSRRDGTTERTDVDEAVARVAASVEADRR